MDNLVQIAKIGNRFWPGPARPSRCLPIACHLLHSSDHSQTQNKYSPLLLLLLWIELVCTFHHLPLIAPSDPCVCAVSRSSAFQLSPQLSYDFSCLTRRLYSACLLRVFVVDSSNLNVQRFAKATPDSPALSARSCREFTLFCCSCGAAFLAS